MKMKKLVVFILATIFCLVADIAIAGHGSSSGTISGTVKDSTSGAAIVGATVTAGTTNATTNSAGSYSMTVSAGNYTVTASATGYTSASQSATVTKGGVTTVNFSLVKTGGTNGTISGTVTDSATGAVIVGATVTAGSTNATTNSAGSYSMTVAAGSYTVTASATGYTTASQPATVTANGTTTVNFSLVKSVVSSNYRVVAWNDLGMHCACPSFAGFLLLPPFNTVRAQVFDVSGRDPVFLSETTRASLGLSVGYSMVENTDATLPLDTYFSQWITYSPKLFPGFQPIVGGKVQGLAGFGLSGNMVYDSNLLDWKAVGIPAYPVVTGDSNKDIMTDPLGGPNRDPYLTANVFVKDSSGQTLAQTTTVVPVAFGGCCSCHLKLAAANGYPSTPAGSFAYLGVLHSQNTSGINIAMIDPDGDGVGGPVRCSWCHWDPAMGESAAPGWPAGTKLLPGATFTLKKSVY